MRIGIVLSQPPSYSEIFFNLKIKGLIDSGVDVTLFVQKNSNTYKKCKVLPASKVYKNKGLQVLQSLKVMLTLIPHLKATLGFLKLEKQAGRSTKQQFKNLLTNAHLLKAKVDWLHFGFTTLALQSEHVAKAIGAKMVVSCRGYDMDVFPIKHNNPYDLVWQNVDKVHAISNYMKQKALENGMRSTTAIKIITPAIDSNAWEISNPVEKSKTIQITTIARLHWIKGLLESIEAMAELKKKGTDFQYHIIGSGPQYEALSFAIDQLGLTGHVKLLGQLKPEVIQNQLQNTDIYVQYSHSEGFCNAVLEAQAMGCLCIVSDGGALPENVLHNQTGIVVPKGKPKQLANAIDELLKRNDDDKRKLVLNAIRRVNNDFDIHDQIKQFMDFYSN
ncbi:glycosyltransferase family 4 protein [Winogradskyella sp. A3E31]|uniref:glycosyltransferase family 4 protein n=1 Tax=Winogradskyella sp. A3E31 TaxID=3349637 RepID=UPI00398AFC8A